MLVRYSPYVDNHFREKGLLDLVKAQMLWLRENTDYSYADIGMIVGYARSTVAIYIKKFGDQVRYLLELFVEKIAPTSGEVIYKTEVPPDGIPSAYVSEIFDNGEFQFLKIGFSAHMKTRMEAHARNRNYGNNNTVIVYKCFSFDDEDQALTMENLLRKFFKQRNNEEDYLRRDRFTEQRVDEEILATLQEKANFILNNF